MKNIQWQEVWEKIQNKQTVNVIDVREPEEVATGKIPNAINIPLSLLEFKRQEIEKTKPYIIVCHSGGRSAMASEFLESYGYDVTNMIGGMSAWQGEVE